MPERRLRVVHVITKLELGGAQQNTLYTVSHLNPGLFETHLVTGTGGFLDAEARSKNEVQVHFCSDLIREIRPTADLRAFRFLRNLFLRLKPDIVHTHSSKAGVLGRLAARSAGIPHIVHTYHGFGFHKYQNPLLFRLYVSMEKLACRRTEHLIFVGKENQEWASELHLLNGCSHSLIRSGVETDRFLNSNKESQQKDNLHIPPDAKVVGMIACLKQQKDPLLYVEVADLVTRELPNVYFLLIGDGELREAVLKRAAEMKYPERFRHLGWQQNPEQILAQLDLLVLTSLWEGVPRVIPEATLSGVCVVASNIPGNREVIFNNRNGVLAEPRNRRDFADKILESLTHSRTVDPEIRDKIRREFDIDAMVRMQEELYLKLAVFTR